MLPRVPRPVLVNLAAWIEDYNQTRRHSALQMNSPIDYELRHPWDAA